MTFGAAYISLFRGLRRHYADREGRKSPAAFSAMAAISAMLLFCLSCIGVIADKLTHGGFAYLAWLHNQRLSAAIAAMLLIYAHRLMLKQLGLYDEPLPAPPERWVFHLRVALGICALCLVSAVGTTLYLR